MKKKLRSVLLFTLIIFSGFGCTKNVPEAPVTEEAPPTSQPGAPAEAISKASSACGSANPSTSMQWLKDIIVKAEDDKNHMTHKGNYMGKIYLASYRSNPVFLITMPMGSGGIAFYLFDCTGARVNIKSTEDALAFAMEAQKGVLIYSNIP